MEQPYVVVVGGVNIDICGKAFEPLIPCDSNPGSVRMSMGGVGRNIAHNLSLLGQKVYLLTALGEDDYADDIRANWAVDRVFHPQMEEARRKALIRGWDKAVRCALLWGEG